ncbi:MAG: hypothetical protein CM15mP38_2690 [Synechococcus sp.]|nr:MAG: hypothetical protein CM15mP38_2690 [Synechococcus sp.]
MVPPRWVRAGSNSTPHSPRQRVASNHQPVRLEPTTTSPVQMAFRPSPARQQHRTESRAGRPKGRTAQARGPPREHPCGTTPTAGLLLRHKPSQIAIPRLRELMQGPLGRGERPINSPQRQIRQFSNLAPALQQRPRHTHHRQGILHRRRRDVALRQIKWQLNRLQRLGQKTRRPLPSVAVDHAPGRSVQREAKNEFGAWTIAVKDQISDQFPTLPLQRHTITAHAIRPPQRVAANGHPLPNNTPRSSYLPQSTPA